MAACTSTLGGTWTDNTLEDLKSALMSLDPFAFTHHYRPVKFVLLNSPKEAEVLKSFGVVHPHHLGKEGGPLEGS